MPEAPTTHPQNYPHHPPVNETRAGRGRPILSAEGLCQVGRTGLSMGETLRRKIRRGPRSSNGIGKSGTSRTSATGTVRTQDYFKLYDYAVDGVRRALPHGARRRAGSRRAGRAGNFLREFLEHCARGTNYVTGKIGSPLDFISFHAKGSPVFTNDHVRMGMANQFKNMNDAFAVIASFPEYKNTAHRHRRIRSRRLRRLPRAAAMPIATARCIPATPPPVFRAR